MISLNKSVAVVSVMMAVLAISPAMTLAAGDEVEKKETERKTCKTSYGGSTDCKTEKIIEEVVHKTDDKGEIVHPTVAAGVEDINWFGIAAVLGISGAVFYMLSKLTAKVYLFE